MEYGDRILMMNQGHVVLDRAGEEKKSTTVDDVLGLFNRAAAAKAEDAAAALRAEKRHVYLLPLGNTGM